MLSGLRGPPVRPPAAESTSWSANGREPYDLSTQVADYPAWIGPPRRTILICTNPRSGSTLLGEALYFARALGCPLEYFHRGFRPFFAERWQAPEIHSYIRAVHRFRTDSTGVLSVKLFWVDIEDMIAELQPSLHEELQSVRSDPISIAPATCRKVQALLAGIFPNPTFIFLTRRDHIRQAVSALVAMQTKLWRSIPGMGKEVPQQDAVYNFGQILSYMALLRHCNAQWRSYLLATGDSIHEVIYEDFVKDYATTVNSLRERLGCPGRLPLPPRMRRQSNSLSDKMVLRFLKECGERGLGMA
jgi:trehalose 2-sulfotransferase